MMYRRLLTSLLFLFSFVVLVIGGYQCATRVTEGPRLPGAERSGLFGRTSIAIDDLYPRGYGQEPYGKYDDRRLPSDSGGCNRSLYRSLAEKRFQAGLARFEFDPSSLENYRLGVRQNFELKCPRMYLNMSKLSGYRLYRGDLRISFQEGRKVHIYRHTSGRTATENKYNRWTGLSWTPNRADQVNKNFHAIFESPDAAIILRMDEVRVEDVRDGETVYLGSGELYYKMFRIWDNSRGNIKADVCHSQGNYAKYVRSPIPRNTRCWLIGTGAFSCRPNGVLPIRTPVTDINITGSLSCYSRLGTFFRLNIKEAFRVGKVQDI